MRSWLVVVVMLAGCAREEELREPSLTLTTQELRLDGGRVVLVKDALRFEYLNIPELESALRELKDERPAANPCADIRSSSALRFAMVKRVLFSCAVVDLPTGFRLANGVAQQLDGRKLRMLMTDEVRQRLAVSPTRVDFDGLIRSTHAVEPPSDDRAFARAVIDAISVELSELPVTNTTELVLEADDDLSLGQLLELHLALRSRGFTIRVAPRYGG